MNKTVNINLAGIFFHIDEDAYAKLQRYLEAIKRSFTDSQGRSEIISDIEARIAELFNERVKHEKQVISTKEVDEVIAIMGQPEDYIVDDTIFEDDPVRSTSRRPSRKLFRDTENSYVGGVSAGLGHYFGIDALWIRLIWILLIFGAGTGVLLYILLWILLPEAVTTSDKLMMTGEPVNITNIEKKIKDGITTVTDSVSETVKNVDLSQQTSKIKSSSKSFFDSLGDILVFFLKAIAKFVGVILIIVGASTLIGLIVALFSVGLSDAINIPGFDIVDAANAANTPVWLVSMLTLFAVGIPFFFVFYLGLKILITNLKSIGNVAKFSLLGLWLLSIVGLIVLGVRQATEHAFEASVTQKDQLDITSTDTLYLSMAADETYSKYNRYNSHRNVFRIAHNENDEKVIYSSDIRLIVRSTKDSLATIQIERNSDGSSFQLAKERAGDINYNYELNGNELLLDSYLTTDLKNKFRDQEIEIILYLPEGSTLYADENTYPFHSNSSYYNDILDHGMEEHFLLVKNNKLICYDCPKDDDDDDDFYRVKIDMNDDDSSIRIDDDGLEIKSEDGSLIIDDKGLEAKSDEVKVNIDEDGIEIISDDPDNSSD